MWTVEVYPVIAAIATGVAVFCGSLGLAPVWDRLAKLQFNQLVVRVEELNLGSARLAGWLRLWGIAMIVVLVAGLVFNMLPLAVGAILIIAGFPKWWLDQMIRRRTTVLRDQMVGACTALANASRAGIGLPAAIEMVGHEISEPLGFELSRISRDYELGKPLPTAISDAKARIKVDSFTLFSNAILIALERGGKITEALDRISRSLQENQRIDRKIEADTQAGRRTVGFLSLFPLGFLGFCWFAEPEGTQLMFTNLYGQILLALCLVGIVVVRRWSEKIINIDV